MSLPLYDCFILPYDSKSVCQWASKFIDFRLTALKSAPKDSTSSYELEAAIPEHEWVSTLSKPAFRVLLCTPRHAGDAATPVWDREWAGILCMHGPRYKHQTTDNCTTSTWYLGSGFVVPTHRGNRALRELFFFGVQQARNLDLRLHHQRRFQTAACRTSIQIIAWADDPKTIGYYRTGGLRITERLTLEEYSKRGWNLLYNQDHLRMPIVVMEKDIMSQETVIMSRL
ncbi:hypothetical protein BJX63DRAFT_384383 [Aspergillus granulosus]|uniref:N-acetyltransferase domain-containing protein n=1 Tax=Aspergillus granulosus TaxID=176169 RepID=A0ABR4HTI3_9EURO